MASKQFAYYFNFPEDHRLQGDVLRHCPLVIFQEGAPQMRPESAALIVSNSCDIDSRNQRIRPAAPAVTLAPVMRLSRCEQLMRDGGEEEGKVNSILADMRKQAITSVFFLPGGPQGLEDSVALLDHAHSMPLSVFEGYGPLRMASLSQTAHWLLLLKLSIHFCRMHEGVYRYDEKPEAAAD